MLGRMAAMAVLIALAGCASAESAGRNARTAAPSTASAPAPAAAAPESTGTQVTQPPALEPTPANPQVAPTTSSSDSAVVVPGTRERQVQPPGGDPRSNAERMQDIRAWDRCVMRVQGAAEADPMRPQLVTPEEYCRESLGMADRTAVPASRLE